MEKLIIFYDDTKAGCCRCVSRFETYENVECRKASDYKDKTLIFATGAKVGFVFESENGKVPYAISHIMWRMVADKKEKHMLLVTGGRREFKAIRTASADLEKRGYHVRNIYTRYILEKYKIKEDEAIEWMLSDIQTGQVRSNMEEKYTGLTRREARKELLRDLKAYRKFQRKNQKQLSPENN